MQVIDRSPYPLLGLVLEQTAFLIICGIRDFPGGEAVFLVRVGLDGDLRMVLPFAQNHQGGIDRDPCEPGRELRSTIEASQVDEGAHKPILKRILCVFTIADDLVNRVKKTRSIDSTYFSKCRPIAVQCS